MKSRRRVELALALTAFACLFVSSMTFGKAVAKPGVSTKPAETNLANVVFAVVDGEPLTAEFVRDTVCITARIRELATKRKPRPFGREANVCAMKLVPQLVQARILERDLMKRKIGPTPESDAETLKKYNRKMRTQAKGVDEMAKLFGEQEHAFRRQFARESRFNALLLAEPSLKVTEQDLSRHYRGLTNQLERCRAINKAAREKIGKARAELDRGVAWDVVATNYTEDALLEPTYADNWQDWMSGTLQQIEPEGLMKAVLTLKPGEYTQPIETDEGLVVAKLVAKDGEIYSLARILVRMGVDVEFPPRKKAVWTLEQEKRETFLADCMEEARKRIRVEYPKGRKFSFAIWPEEAKRRPGKPGLMMGR